MTSVWSRRRVLGGIGAAGLLAAPRVLTAAPARHERFSFLFITDTHLEPELNAAGGCAQCFRRARTIPSDFVIQGGDHVFDALAVGRSRASQLIDLYTRTEQDLGRQVHHTIGNHDCFGVLPASGVASNDPLYGKKFFEARFGALYYAFDHRGVHFVVLDSIGFTTDAKTGAHDYEGRIDAAQLAWLAGDLTALRPGTPIVVVSHIPLVTAFSSYVTEDPVHPIPPHKTSVANAPDVLALLRGHNVLGVLQGHTHINEIVWWQGVPFITSGAVSGNWWHGTRLGTPEGFSVVEVAENRLNVRYETYGFHSVAPRNT
jgi:3',5'-cyclic AMP phosphodiesterase CpdA